MSAGEAASHHVRRIDEAAGESKGLEDFRFEGLLVGLPGHRLDDASRHDESGVVVGPDAAEWRQLLDVFQCRYVERDRVVTRSLIFEDVAFPAPDVGEQIAHRGVLRGVLVGNAEVRDEIAHAIVEPERFLLDEPEQKRACERFGDRADLEQRLVRHAERVIHVRHAEPLSEPSSFVDDTHGGAGYTQLLHLLGDDFAQRVEARFGILLVGSGRGERRERQGQQERLKPSARSALHPVVSHCPLCFGRPIWFGWDRG